MKTFILLITLITISSCASHKLPKYLSFKIECSYEEALDTYDSENSEYQRNYTDGVVKIKVKLSNKERILINNYFEEANF